jgi:competence protein ComGC
MIKKYFKKNAGTSMIEMLFYIVLLSMLSVVVINAMITMMKSFQEVSMRMELVRSGNILETISREIKKSYSINSINPSDLILNSRDDSGNTKTVEFSLSGTNLLLKENSTLTGNLNSPGVAVLGIIFTQITTAKGSAIKVEMSIAPKSRIIDTENFYDTIVLRGNY